MLQGSDLVLSGWARPGSTIELFISDKDGSSDDTDPGTGTYADATPGNVKGTATHTGTDTTNRFRFVIPLPDGVSAGTALTATASCLGTDCAGTTVTANSTSEFSPNIIVTNKPDIKLVKYVHNKNAASSDPSSQFGFTGTGLPGQTLQYCITFRNAGGFAANFKITDAFPINTQNHGNLWYTLYNSGAAPDLAGTSAQPVPGTVSAVSTSHTTGTFPRSSTESTAVPGVTGCQFFFGEISLSSPSARCRR